MWWPRKMREMEVRPCCKKTHQILKFTPTVSPVDASEDAELVSGMMTKEMTLDIGPDIAGCARFRS
jgi:hypothetical protein